MRLELTKIKNFDELKKVCSEKELEQVFHKLLKEKINDPTFNESEIEFIDRINETLVFNDLYNEISFSIYLK